MSPADGPFADGSSMAALIDAFDWSSTSLGPRDQWSPVLRTSLDIVLSSRFPMLLWWGPDLVMLYNDAYSVFLSGKHPAALGQPGFSPAAWGEEQIRSVIEPMLRGVLDRSEATWSDHQLLILERNGFPEETYFTWSYSPVHEDGRVVGIFTAVTDATGTVVGERRLKLLAELTERTRDSVSAEAACRSASEVIAGARLDVPFHLLFLRDGDAWPLVAGTGMPASTVAADVALAGSRGETIVVDLAARDASIPTPVWPEPVTRVALVPLLSGGEQRVNGVIALGASPRLPWHTEYQEFFDLIAARVGSAIADARASEHERRRTQALEELNRSKSAFLTSVSHEFRTPLTLILGPLEDVLATPNSRMAAEDRQRITTARDNGLRLLRLVNSLLEFSRAEAGGAQPTLRAENVSALTLRLASVFGSAFESAGLRYEIDIDDSDAAHELDADMWESIVFNLLSNALKYTRDGSVRLRLSYPDGAIQLEVVDTGLGIASDEVDKVFDRFYRSSDVGGRSIEGAGIGLALVRELARLHGGEVSVDSARGEGSTFTVRLPGRRVVGSATAVEQPPLSQRAQAFLEEARRWLVEQDRAETGGVGEAILPRRADRAVVLVVDDNPDMREYLASILGADNDVVVAEDGSDALRVARLIRPDVIVSDVMMPRVDGFALVERLRAEESLAATAVMLLSARAGADSVAEGLEHGADDYLVKPFTARELKARVAALFNSVRRHPTAEAPQRRIPDPLTQLATALTGAADLQQVADATFAASTPFGALVGVTLSVLESDGTTARQYFGGPAMPGDLRARYLRTNLSSDTPHTRVINDGIPRFFGDMEQLAAAFPRTRDELTRLGVGAAAVIPFFTIDGDILGCVSFGWPQSCRFAADAVSALHRITELVGHAVERVQLSEHEREIARTLQLRLLNLDARTTDAVVRAKYRAADDAMEVGGDWYDAKALDDGRLVVAVGDVVGHGLAAAATMSQLRSALGALVLHAGDPAQAIDMLDRFAIRIPGALGTTVALAFIDPVAETLTYYAAGHMPPLMVTPDGTVSLLEAARSWPIGVGLEGSRPDAVTVAFPAGSLLFLYTDGLVERRGELIDVGLARLCDVVREHWRLPLPRLKAEIFAALLDASAVVSGDDAAVVAVRTYAANANVYVDGIRARPLELAPLRKRLGAWLRAHDVMPGLEDDFMLAVGEACANAIDHGSNRNGSQLVRVEAGVLEDVVVVTVTDSGQWQPGVEGFLSGRGRGHTIMRTLADDVMVQSDNQGTAVTLYMRRQSRSAPADAAL